MANHYENVPHMHKKLKTHLRPYIHFCAKLRQENLLRQLPKAQEITFDFSSNDYLGLSQHPQMIEAATEAATQFGVGAKASRLITTQQQQLIDFEKQIAASKHAQAALIFATGFQANLSALSALLDRKILGVPPLVFADKLNHASMHAGCQLAQAKQIRYRHNDLDHLAWLLAKTQSQKQPRFILTESVFGMDGDVADLATLIKLAKQYQALLYVDEAHATGLFGYQGYGLSADFDGEVDISMGTFSKALGGSGAYVACSQTLKKYFINRCSGLIFSTAPSPMQVAAMQKAWSLVPSYQTCVKTLLCNATQIRLALTEMGYEVGSSTTQIIPIIFKDPKHTLVAQQFLKTRGIRVSAIRPPSVPIDKSRLRIALSVTHKADAQKKLLNALKEFKKE